MYKKIEKNYISNKKKGLNDKLYRNDNSLQTYKTVPWCLGESLYSMSQLSAFCVVIALPAAVSVTPPTCACLPAILY